MAGLGWAVWAANSSSRTQVRRMAVLTAPPSGPCCCLPACPSVLPGLQQEAQESLEYALQHCHKAAQRNKALVLKYLVPVSWVGWRG